MKLPWSDFWLAILASLKSCQSSGGLWTCITQRPIAHSLRSWPWTVGRGVWREKWTFRRHPEKHQIFTRAMAVPARLRDHMEKLAILPILLVLLVLHELGHFVTARLNGITVEEFAVGFPPRVASTVR